MIILAISIFLIASILPFFLKNEKFIRLGAIFFAILGSGAVLAVSAPTLFFDASWSNALWLVDSFSALMTFLIIFVYVTAIIVSYRYIGFEYHEGIITLSQVKMYFSLIQLFVLSMLVTVLANNSMLIWIALEGTTLSSTFLVGLYKKRTSIEAAWKYIILCSTGITLGLIGVLLANYAAHTEYLERDIFTLNFLADNASQFSPEIIKWAFVFLFVGFGAKVGLVPMHAWLPDAHSKAPSPVSALFSGILLNVALYVIMRFKHIADGTLGGSEWTNNFFLIFGVMSVILPALALLIQNNYKRMLAYSSIEHMGLISLAVALPPLGLTAAFIHMIGHTLNKSLLFFAAGEFLLRWKTTKIEKISGLMKYAPYSGTLFLLGIMSIIAVPPSLLFVSEYILFTKMFSAHWFLALVVLTALTLIAFAMLRLAFTLLFGERDEEKMEKEKWGATHTIMVMQLMLIVGLTFALTSSPGLDFINNIIKVVNS